MFTLTPNILKNFLSQPATRYYPFETRKPFDGSRGLLVNDIAKCIFCGICSMKCPSQCITVDKKAGTWQCDPFACVFCGVCVDSCPENALSQKTEYRRPVQKPELIFLQGTPKPLKKSE